MRRWDQTASVLGIVLGFLLVMSSLRINLGQWNHPGPGFMPLGSGLLLILLCVAYGARSIRIKHRKQESPWPRENIGKLIGVQVALFLFALVLTTLGYLLSTFLLMIFLFQVVEQERWFITIIKTALIVFVTYVVFDKWLMVQFPRGFLEF